MYGLTRCCAITCFSFGRCCGPFLLCVQSSHGVVQPLFFLIIKPICSNLGEVAIARSLCLTHFAAAPPSHPFIAWKGTHGAAVLLLPRHSKVPELPAEGLCVRFPVYTHDEHRSNPAGSQRLFLLTLRMCYICTLLLYRSYA